MVRYSHCMQISNHHSSYAVGWHICHKLNVVVELKTGLSIALSWDEVYNQRVLDCKHGVVIQVLVFAVKDLGSERAVALARSLESTVSIETVIPVQRRHTIM